MKNLKTKIKKQFISKFENDLSEFRLQSALKFLDGVVDEVKGEALKVVEWSETIEEIQTKLKEL